MEKQSPVQRIWELGEAQHGKLITAVVMAAVGVICGMVPYFAAAGIIALPLYAKNISVDKGAPVRASLCCFLP